MLVPPVLCAVEFAEIVLIESRNSDRAVAVGEGLFEADHLAVDSEPGDRCVERLVDVLIDVGEEVEAIENSILGGWRLVLGDL